jgi:hypothetical protein
LFFYIEEDRKRKFDENEITERKKPCGIWSLADMAEKNSNKNLIDKDQQRRSSSISSSSSSSSPTSSQGFFCLQNLFSKNFFYFRKI